MLILLLLFGSLLLVLLYGGSCHLHGSNLPEVHGHFLLLRLVYLIHHYGRLLELGLLAHSVLIGELGLGLLVVRHLVCVIALLLHIHFMVEN